MYFKKFDEIFLSNHYKNSINTEPKSVTIIPIKKNMQTLDSQQSAMSILNNIFFQRYQTEPLQETIFDDGKFFTNISIGSYHVTDSAISKKTSKQKAAKKLLMEIIEKGEHEKFGIPGKTMEEAREFINKLQIETEIDPEDVGKWIALCNEYRQKNKLDAFSYEFNEIKNKINVSFECKVTFNDFFAIGNGRSKKFAKNQASKKLYEYLEQTFGPLRSSPEKNQNLSTTDNIDFTDQNKNNISFDTPTENNVDDSNLNLSKNSTMLSETIKFTTCQLECPDPSDEEEDLLPPIVINKNVIIKDKQNIELAKLIKEIIVESEQNQNFDDSMVRLSKTLQLKNDIVQNIFKKFFNLFKYEPIDKLTSRGEHQVFLKVRDKKNRLQYFLGIGSTQNEASNDASWQAIRFVYLFENFDKILLQTET